MLHFGFSVASAQAQFQSFGMQTQLMASPGNEGGEHLGDWNGLGGLHQQEEEDGMSELSLRGEQADCAKANPAPVDPSSRTSQPSRFSSSLVTRGIMSD